MAIEPLPKIRNDDSLEKLRTAVGAGFDVIEYLLNGGLDSLNIRRLTADKIYTGTLNAQKVTIRSDLNGGAYIVIDGTGMTVSDGTQTTLHIDTDGNITLIGTLNASIINGSEINGGTITGSLIQTDDAGVYPRVELNAALNLLSAYFSATNSIKINPTIPPNPTLDFEDGTVHGVIGVAGGKFLFSTPFGEGDIQFSSGEDLELFPQGLIRVASWSKVFSNLGSENQTLKQALDSKAPAFTGFTGSIPPGATIHVDNGVIQSYTL